MKKYPIFIMFIILLVGCSNNNPVLPSEEDAIMPLKIGNQWIGKAERIGNNGEVISISYSGISIVGENKNDSTAYSIMQLENGIKLNCENTEYGFAFIYNGKSYLHYKYPAIVGDSYRVSSNTFIEVISIDSLISTEFGEFNCVHYSHRRDNSESHTEEFVAPNYGYIYEEHYQTDGPTPEIFLYSRTSYNPILMTE